MQIREILVPLDFSPHSERSLDAAIELAERFDARLHVLHAYQLPTPVGVFEQIAVPSDFATAVQHASRARLDSVCESLRERGIEVEPHLDEGAPTTAIIEEAKRLGVDLIVMGTRGHTLAHALLGSVADRTVHYASCPVLVVP